MKLQFAATNALNKWLKADLARLPTELGKQAGVNTLISDEQQFSWQVHIIDNQYKSLEKTIIATEAHSRFSLFIPINARLTLAELTQRLLMEWQRVLAETLESYQIIAHSDIAYLLSDLGGIDFQVSWVRNTDLSISGNITNARLMVTDTLRDRHLEQLPPQLALDLVIYLNTKTKRTTNKNTKGKEKFIPVERLLAYVQKLNQQTREQTSKKVSEQTKPLANNVVSLCEYKKMNKR
ncbi:amino acid adenylation [Colwellia sp. MT41]|uniref:Amino acid adenylation n=1 Tax=Colwellia marinimaniae TaxID=1513592 RepID=A0ABQ0MUE6_9GAMM|nr:MULTISPECIES: hypothetical protein [Colwellia]ALO35305.1 amino acid adenylation [Colwellia sp. MT41]GAW95979.1 hypothetical protein MTCD1_01585 [Colwellia marinimaniae]